MHVLIFFAKFFFFCSEERYLKQHVGSKKCKNRKKVVDATSSMTLSLNQTNAHSSSVAQVSFLPLNMITVFH